MKEAVSRFSLAVFIFSTLLVATPISASTGTYYLNASTGDVATGNGSQGTPSATIGKAFKPVRSNENNTVYYDPFFDISNNIVSIAIAAYPRGNSSLVVDFYPVVVGGNIPYTYAWNFGDGSNSNQANPTHTYASRGDYNVTLTVSDGRTQGQNTIIVNPIEDAHKPKAEYAYKTTETPWTAYISPDIASRLYFYATDPNMPKEPSGRYWIHVVVPEGVSPVGISTRRSTYSGPPESIRDLGTLSRDGKDYHYYIIEIPPSTYTLEFFLYVKTTLEVGTKTNMYYWGSSMESESSAELTTRELTLPVEVISVHKVQNKPKRLLIGQGWENMGTYTAWPNFDQEFPSLGLNLILLTEMHSDGSFGTAKPAIQQFVNDANSVGINIGIAMQPDSIMNYYLKDHPEAQAIRPDGTIWTNGSQLSLCPCYRGNLFDQIMLDPMREIASAGISFVVFDYEMGYDGQLSYSDLCLSKFQTYLATKYPQLTYRDPRVFEAQPDQYPEYHEAWSQFMSDQIAEWFSLQKQTFEEAVQEYGAHSSPGVYIGDYGGPAPFSRAAEVLFYPPKNLQNGLDFVMPVSYVPYDPSDIRQKAEDIRLGQGYRDFAYPAPNLIYWTTLGWTGGDIMMGPTGRYQFLEILAQGARGFVLYDGSGLDARNFDMLSRIIDAIAPVEDIILDGEHFIAGTSDPETVAHGQRLGDEMVLVVSDYGTEQKESTVTVPVTKESTVYNLETGEEMGTLTPQNDTFTVTFAENRAALVHISPGR
jgi:PKD repeat protein